MPVKIHDSELLQRLLADELSREEEKAAVEGLTQKNPQLALSLLPVYLQQKHRSMWYGQTEAKIRELFALARKAAAEEDSCIVLFFDDVDHLGSRGDSLATPMQRLDDPLYFPNLYNVAAGYGQQCWLCLANLKKNLVPLPWEEKVREVRAHL
jgi:hypothetical protein